METFGHIHMKGKVNAILKGVSMKLSETLSEVSEIIHINNFDQSSIRNASKKSQEKLKNSRSKSSSINNICNNNQLKQLKFIKILYYKVNNQNFITNFSIKKMLYLGY